MAAIAVPRLLGLTPDSFARDFVEAQTPVVLGNTGICEDYGPNWGAPAVASALGETQFRFKRSSCNAHPDFRAERVPDMFASETMTFRRFFELILQGPEELRNRYIFTGDEHYLARRRGGEWSINPDLEPLWRTLSVPSFVPQAQIYSVWSWFSGKGVRTWLHYDNNGCHNLNAQLRGEKRCTLFPPSALAEIEFYGPGQPVPAYNCSSVDVEAPGPQGMLARLPHYEATLKAGDLLFIPAHWLHSFCHEGTYNANVNFWWKPLLHEYPKVDDNAVARREARLAEDEGR